MRSSRWLALTVLTATLFVIPTHAAKPTLTTLIAETQVGLWKCQDQRGVPRTSTSVPPWKLPKSHAYRKWTLRLWKQRKTACSIALHLNDDVVRRLNRGLSGSPMQGTGRELEAAARRHGVHPAFIAAIAGTESSFGAAACSNNRYNAFGLSSCGSGWSVPYFGSWAEAYDFMARFLTGKTSVTRGWPGARTTYDFHGYAACSDCWGRKTAYWMSSRFGYGNSVRYP